MRQILLLFVIARLSVQVAVAQKKQQVMIHDFEDKPATQSWNVPSKRMPRFS